MRESAIEHASARECARDDHSHARHARCVQYKYERCVGLFNDWVERSGFASLTEWKERTRMKEVLKADELHACCDESGTVRMPTAEMICDFLLQARAPHVLTRPSRRRGACVRRRCCRNVQLQGVA